MKHSLSLFGLALALAACTPESLESPVSSEPETIPVRTVELSSASLSLHPGDKVSLTAAVVPSDATDADLAWSSSDEAVATVSQSGEVTALSVGEAVISANCGWKKAECRVTVSLKYVPVSSFTLDRTGVDLRVGETLLLEATVSPSDATEGEVVWTSLDTEVAAVENGQVTALSEGETVITAAAGDCSATCLVKVTVPFSYGGMCMEAVSFGFISVSNPNRLTIEYKVGDGDWTSSSSATVRISAEAGEKVWFRGENESYTGGNEDDGRVRLLQTLQREQPSYQSSAAGDRAAGHRAEPVLLQEHVLRMQRADPRAQAPRGGPGGSVLCLHVRLLHVPEDVPQDGRYEHGRDVLRLDDDGVRY